MSIELSMDGIVEEIALVPGVTQNQGDEEVSNKRKLHVLIREFNSKKHLKEFILWIILFICLLLLTGPLALRISYALPPVKTRTIANHIFSEERARDYLTNLSQYGPRVSNTRGNFDARDYLVSQIKYIYSMSKRNLQFEVDLQNLTDSNQNQIQNVLVRVSNPIIKYKNVSSLLLTAHYDSVEFSPGSCDDGSGVVILLELFSNLVNDLTVTFSDMHLIILFTNAEEIASQGAQAFLINHIWNYNVHRFINIDAANCNEKANLVRMEPSQLVMDYSRVPRPRANVILEDISKRIRLIGDYDTFSFEGSLKGYDFGFILDGYFYHTSRDDPSMIKQGVFQDLGDNLGILIRNILLGHVYLEKTENSIDTDSFIYFDILGRYLIVYKAYTSIIVQAILIILIVAVGIILIIVDHMWHRKKLLRCNDSRCVYFHFKYPFLIRTTSIIIYFISNSISLILGILFSMGIAWIMSKIRPVSWFASSTVAIFLFGLPYLIAFLTIRYLCIIFHRFILRKSFKNSIRFDTTINDEHLNEVNFDFEQNLSILFVYSLLMIISIYSDHRSLYIVLVWSIFMCPINLLLMIIEFIIHWKQIQWNFFEQKYHWLFLPMIISLLPLTHTIEIIHRLLRVVIPILARRFSFGWSLRANILVCSIIIIPSTFFILISIPILQRIKHFGRILILLLITFFIIFLFAFIRQPFNKNYPNVFYAKHTSKSIFKLEKLSHVPWTVPLITQSSSIMVLTYDDIALSSVLDHFSTKSGHILHNKRCFRPTNCTFDDTFNRTIAVQNIKIKSMENLINYTIVVRHILAYNIQVSSFSLIKFIIRNQSNVPRTKTIIDVTLKSILDSFSIDIKIRRCDLMDSPFLLLFTRSMTNIVLMGKGQCQAIEDDVNLIFDLNAFSN